MPLGQSLGLPFRRSRAGALIQYLLDQYPGAAAAFALFKLRGDYADSLIRVRRSFPTITGDTSVGSNVITNVSSTANCQNGMRINGSGIPTDSTIVSFTANTITISANATAPGAGTVITLGNDVLDVGLSGDDLDTASLLAFCGAGDGSVTEWYRQSTADATNLTQTNATLQPRIVIAGVLQTSNGLPAIKHDATHYLTMTGFVARPSTATIFDVLDYSGGRAFLGPTPISNVYFGNIFPTDTGTTTLQSNSGATGDYYANGELIAQNGVDSRDDLAAGLLAAASPQLISVVDGVDLSDSEYANYRTEYDLSAAVDAFPSRQLIVIYPQASIPRTAGEAFIANKFGITLS